MNSFEATNTATKPICITMYKNYACRLQINLLQIKYTLDIKTLVHGEKKIMKNSREYRKTFLHAN